MLGESMLSVPDHLALFQMLHNGFCENLLHVEKCSGVKLSMEKCGPKKGVLLTAA